MDLKNGSKTYENLYKTFCYILATCTSVEPYPQCVWNIVQDEYTKRGHVILIE